MTVHSIKLDTKWYDRIADGTKRVEIRKADRDYQIGDRLVMCEIDLPSFGFEGRTGRFIAADITHVLYGIPGLDSNYVALSISNPQVHKTGETATTEGDSL